MNSAVHLMTGVGWGVAHGVATTSVRIPRIVTGLASGA